jgi:hypothetical protein
VELASQLKEILNQVSELVVKFSDHTTEVSKAVKLAIDQNRGIQAMSLDRD